MSNNLKAAVAEAAAVGVADELTGQSIQVFVGLKSIGSAPVHDLRDQLIRQVRTSIGPFAAPKKVHIVQDLPKTSSGKIMRRILRKVLHGEEDSLRDITTVSTKPSTQDRPTPSDQFHSCRTLRL